MSGTAVLYALIFLMVAFWSGNYIAGKIALRELSPLFLAGLRIGLAGVMILPLYVWEQTRRRPERRPHPKSTPGSLPHIVRYDMAQATGVPVTVTEEYGDFREIGGVKIPHQIAIARGGRKFADVTVTESRINSGLKTLELARRTQ